MLPRLALYRPRQQCLFAARQLSFPVSRFFHSTPPRRADDEDYYQVLGVPSGASQADIKKSFYSLSKKHHPDHNPGDPTASVRFASISNAYTTLGNPSKRATYDRSRPSPPAGSSRHQRPAGSHSSSTTTSPFGARSPSGLSKRRTQFRGPPPSFYRSGGWGSQGAKRRANQDSTGSAGETDTAGGGGGGGGGGQGNTSGANTAGSGSTSSTAPGGGFSPGQGTQSGADYDVPHFDRDGHYRTQTQQEQRRRRRMHEQGDGNAGFGPGGSMDFFVRFVVIGGIISFACAVPALFSGPAHATKRREREE